MSKQWPETADEARVREYRYVAWSGCVVRGHGMYCSAFCAADDEHGYQHAVGSGHGPGGLYCKQHARQAEAEVDPAQEATAARLVAIGAELQRLTAAYTAAGRLGEPEFLAAAEVLWRERDALAASQAEQAAPLPIDLPATRRELRRVLDGLSHDERGVLLRRVLVSATVQGGHLVGPPRLR